ncbi:MAG: potassium channel family protein [Acidimicrobiia bacterium]
MNPKGVFRRITISHRILRSFVILVVIVALYFLVPPRNRAGGPGAVLFSLIVMAVAFTLFGLSVRRRIREYRKGGNWQATGLETLVLAILITAVLFASLYFALASYPGQIEGIQTKIDALYFSVTTLATVGYGDIHPAGQVTRVVATFQMLFDLVFIATGTGLVVSSMFARAQAAVVRGNTQPTTGTTDPPGP